MPKPFDPAVHHLTLLEQVDLGPRDCISPGEYYLDDVTGGHLIAFSGSGQMTPLVEKRPFDPEKDWNGKSILFMRLGGFGDLILLTPVLRELNRRWPNLKIAVCTMGHYAVALHGLPYVSQIVRYPCSKQIAETFDAWVWLENAIERNPAARTKHMTDLYASIAGLPEDFDNKLPDYRVSGNEEIWSKEAYPRTPGLPRVVIQVGTSSVARTYHRNAMGMVVKQLLNKSWEIYLIGGRNPNGTPEVEVPFLPGLKNLCLADLSFRQSAAVVDQCDAFIGSDSAFLHVAGALGVPAVGLYGPFPWQLRTAYCPTTVALQGTGPCAPCFHHAIANKQNDFPVNCPSAHKGFCEVLAGITPDKIVHKIEKIARGTKTVTTEPVEEEAKVVKFETDKPNVDS